MDTYQIIEKYIEFWKDGDVTARYLLCLITYSCLSANVIVGLLYPQWFTE